MLALSSVVSAQVVYPYNPDVEPDGYIGVNDLLALLPIFGQEFQVVTVDSDTTSVLILVDEAADWVECKQQCMELGSGWDIVSVDGTIQYMDTLSATTIQGYGGSTTWGSTWWTNERTKAEVMYGFGREEYQNGVDPPNIANTISTTGQLDGDRICWCEAEVRPEIEYQILVESAPTLQVMVQEAIDEGWFPLGGVGGYGFPLQAMWRYAD